MQTDDKAPFLNPIPWVIWLLALPMIAMEVVVSAGAAGLVGGQGAIGWRMEAVNRFAFSPELFRWMVENRVFPPEAVARVVTYPFVHGSVTHTVFAVVFLLALGKMVAEVFRPWAVLVLFFGAGIGAALLQVVAGLEQPLFGAYPPDYGLIGAFTTSCCGSAWRRWGPMPRGPSCWWGCCWGFSCCSGCCSGGRPIGWPIWAGS